MRRKVILAVAIALWAAVLMVGFYYWHSHELTQRVAAQAGMPMPPLTLTDMQGNTIHLAAGNLGSRPTLLVVNGYGCAPCRRENQTLHNILQGKYDLPPFKLVQVLTSPHKEVDFDFFLKHADLEGLGQEVYNDEQKTIPLLLGTDGVPETLLIDTHGNMVWRHKGFAPTDRFLFDEKLRRALAQTGS